MDFNEKYGPVSPDQLRFFGQAYSLGASGRIPPGPVKTLTVGGQQFVFTGHPMNNGVFAGFDALMEASYSEKMSVAMRFFELVAFIQRNQRRLERAGLFYEQGQQAAVADVLFGAAAKCRFGRRGFRRDQMWRLVGARR